MAIPIATTTIRVWRKDSQVASTDDPWDEGYPGDVTNNFAILDEGVRAVISTGGGTYSGRTVGPGDSEVVTFTLLADPCDLQYLDEVEDQATGQRYSVSWAISSPGIGGELASLKAGLETRKGT